MKLAIALSEKSVAEGGGPFGAVIVRGGASQAAPVPIPEFEQEDSAHEEI